MGFIFISCYINAKVAFIKADSALINVGSNRIIYRRAYSSYILYMYIENCRGEYLLLHACLYISYLPRYFLPGPFLLVLFFHA